MRVEKMIFGKKIRQIDIPVALAVAAALAMAWIAQSSLMECAGWVRLTVVAGCLTFICCLFHVRTNRHQSAQRTARRYVDLLSRLDHYDLANSDLEACLPKLDENSPWRPVFISVRQCLTEFAQRADEMEHACVSAEVRLRRLTKEHLQVAGILDNLAEPVLAVNNYDELIWVNQCGRELFKIDPLTDSPVPLAEVIDCPPVVSLLTETRRRKSPTQRCAEISVVDADGRTRWFRATCRSLGDDPSDGDDGHGAVVILTDVSSEKGIQRRHAEFVASASHEMKTPLAAILAYAELLQDGDVEDEATRTEFLGIIDGQAVRLQRLIDNLLNLARIEAGVVNVDKQTRSLNELLEQAQNVVQPTAEQKGMEFAVDLSPMYLAILADRDMMVQTAINLLSNAIKYTKPGGKVTLRSRMEENAAVFEVEDTGIGLSEEDRQKVFQRFYRVKKGKDMASGTGLGLPLAKHIVEDVHGGSLTVTSQLGKGSLFRVTLPSVAQRRVS
ncbi:MAG: sensor histidine kinase [Pirellulaceae bacterium]